MPRIGPCLVVALSIAVVACSSAGDERSDARADPTTAAAVDDGSSIDGGAIYQDNCAVCHAADGSGGLGPALADGAANSAFSSAEMVEVVTEGSSGMPGFADQLHRDEIDAVVAYIRDDLTGDQGASVTVPASTDAAAPAPTTSTANNDSSDDSADATVEASTAWPSANGELAADRATSDSNIDLDTVTELAEIWRYEIPGGSFFGNLATNPIIVDDAVYVEALDGIVHRVDRATGELRWTAGTLGALFGPTGVAVDDGRVFATQIGPSGRGQLIAAYDADSGDELWSTDITENGGEVNVQALAFDGLVYASTSGFPAGTRGTIHALDQTTGEIVWSFATVESEDLWGHPEINSGGGAWYPPAVDIESGVLYWGVGNPWPMPGAEGYPAGSSRPGDNRWTSGTVALDAGSGEIIWGFQAFPHDLFDRDHVLAGLATDLTGVADDVLVTAGKGGVVFGHDPTDGTVLWSTPVGQHQNDDVTEFDGPLEVLPGAQGGAVTPLATADGVAYFGVINAAIEFSGPEESANGFGTQLGTRPSNVVAIDVTSGEIVWDVEVDGDVFGGMTVINDLLVTSTFGGEILGFDRESGEQVWSHQADGGINGWPAVSGDLLVVPVGIGEPPHLLALELP